MSMHLAPSVVAHVLMFPGHITSFAAVSPYTLSPGRLGAIVAGLLALSGVIVAGLTLAGRVRRGAGVAMITGGLGGGLGAVVAMTASGGLGTGNGLGGAIVAIVVGLIAIMLGALALRRARRVG